MAQIVFEILGIPVAKGRPRFARSGKFVRTYTPGKTRAHEANILAQAIPFRPLTPVDVEITLDMTFYLPIPKSIPKKILGFARSETMPVITRPDLDNMEKAVLDALNGVFWTDDSRIAVKHARKVYSLRPRTKFIMCYMEGKNEQTTL